MEFIVATLETTSGFSSNHQFQLKSQDGNAGEQKVGLGLNVAHSSPMHKCFILKLQ